MYDVHTRTSVFRIGADPPLDPEPPVRGDARAGGRVRSLRLGSTAAGSPRG